MAEPTTHPGVRVFTRRLIIRALREISGGSDPVFLPPCPAQLTHTEDVGGSVVAPIPLIPLSRSTNVGSSQAKTAPVSLLFETSVA